MNDAIYYKTNIHLTEGQVRVIPLRALDDDIGIMHKRTNGELTPIENRDFAYYNWMPGFSNGYRDNPTFNGMVGRYDCVLVDRGRRRIITSRVSYLIIIAVSQCFFWLLDTLLSVRRVAT